MMDQLPDAVFLEFVSVLGSLPEPLHSYVRGMLEDPVGTRRRYRINDWALDFVADARPMAAAAVEEGEEGEGEPPAVLMALLRARAQELDRADVPDAFGAALDLLAMSQAELQERAAGALLLAEQIAEHLIRRRRGE